MYIPKLRRISDVIKEIKAQDPNSPVSWYFLRELCKKGKITTLKYATRGLLTWTSFIHFFKVEVNENKYFNFFGRTYENVPKRRPRYEYSSS